MSITTMNKLFVMLALLLLASCQTETPVAQPTHSRALTEINLAEIGALGPKGRVQDAEYTRSPVVKELLAHGKSSIPYLISKLDDETKIDSHVMDYWHEVRVGDVALIVLSDFFTDRSWQHTTLPAVSWDEFLERGHDRHLTSEQVLRSYIAKHGRLNIKTRWQQIWETHQKEIFWDEAERCFNVADCDPVRASVRPLQTLI